MLFLQHLSYALTDFHKTAAVRLDKDELLGFGVKLQGCSGTRYIENTVLGVLAISVVCMGVIFL